MGKVSKISIPTEIIIEVQNYCSSRGISARPVKVTNVFVTLQVDMSHKEAFDLGFAIGRIMEKNFPYPYPKPVLVEE